MEEEKYSGLKECFYAFLIIAVISFLAGGFSLMKIVLLGTAIMLFCVFFWLYGYKYGEKFSRRFNFYPTFKVTYFSLLALFLIAILLWGASIGGYCAPRTYGDIYCGR
jgi:uncharacterized membrane protein YozB (DUF420 family)